MLLARAAFLDGYQVHQVGGEAVLDFWIPAEDLEAFNDDVEGGIEIVASYRSPHPLM